MHNSKEKVGTPIKTEESKDSLYQKQLEQRIELQQETIKLLLEAFDAMHFVTNDMFFCSDDYAEAKRFPHELDESKMKGKNFYKAFKALKFGLLEKLPLRREIDDRELACVLKVVDRPEEQNKLYELTRKIYRAVNDETLTPELVKSFFDEWDDIRGEERDK
jgi:hypothetical protein